tara:strand:- start:49 stop:1032 length:984 start_codon:yes stop_codon:yes gene_type:complete
MGILDNLYKAMLPSGVERTVVPVEKKPVPKTSTEEVDSKAMQELYQQMLQDSNRVITPVEIEREQIEKQQKAPPQRDALVEELEAQNTEELSDMYETMMAGAGEFGTGEYKGPTKKQLGLTPKIIVDEVPQDFVVKEEPVITEQPKEKKPSNIINYDSGLVYNKNTDTYSSTDPKMNALLSVESSGKHTKKGKINVPGGDVDDLTKARGLTQLKPTSFSDLEDKKKYARNFNKSYSVDEIDNPETNYIIGEQYLKSLFKDFKNLGYSEDDAQDLGYIAYNQGYQAVVDWLAGKKSLKKEGQEYIGKINKELGIDRGIKDRKKYKKIK